ncbi:MULTISPECIES: hypothetical protein [unclassified Allobranchiibius]|uniref:hypothetical protein n=1 Tax=unclassified Allobranchiibius TaxID=2649857 RepID=UPI001AA0BBFA|nr:MULTISPECIES: hypothetical protein [unclassified Allobranchiibius]MBO1765299.1 hypothetical protein [Allobranchiibius sp. GilTou38]UIJ35175.1 hypothetical protein LVQ62_01890 [Allobranchiibius sp. GilTou73]
MATDKVKKIVIWAVFVFLLYAIFTDPHHSAGIVHNIWSILQSGVQHIGDFYHDILHS